MKISQNVSLDEIWKNRTPDHLRVTTISGLKMRYTVDTQVNDVGPRESLNFINIELDSPCKLFP